METEEQRKKLLQQLDEVTEVPFTVLSLVWLGLVIYDFIVGLNSFLTLVFYVIWAFFILHFIIEFLLAPVKKEYIKSHILTLISLFIPTVRALRIFRSFRLLRASRAIRSVSLVQVVTSLNRGMKTIRTIMGSRGVGYVALLSALVIIIGSIAIFYFENPEALKENGYRVTDAKITNYADAVWFTSMLMVTIGSEYWPKSTEGRILTFILSLYSFGVFGFVTATIASFILGKDYNKKQSIKKK